MTPAILRTERERLRYALWLLGEALYYFETRRDPTRLIQKIRDFLQGTAGAR